MNKYWIIALVVATVVIGAQWQQLKEERNKREIAEANTKAYSLELSNAKDKSVALQLTADQLKYFNDSILKALNATKEELNIKDKNLKSLQQVTTYLVKNDTIVLKDTIFKQPTFALDTLIKDEWYSLKLGLKYPSTITASPEFKSEKHIIVSTKKETVNPPKKFFLFRWFQRKHTVLQVDVVEKNPHIDCQTSRYVEIIK